MKIVKKLLFIHPEPRVRRRSVMLLAAAGFDLRTASNASEALDEAKAEWVDLAIVPYRLANLDGKALADELRKNQPTLLVMLTVPQVDYALAFQSVKAGIVDIIPMDEDPSPLVSAICNHYNVVPECEVNAEDIRKAEAVLDCIAGIAPRTASKAPFNVMEADHASEMVALAKEQAQIEHELERMRYERNLFEAQLKTLLMQNDELSRLESSAGVLSNQRELIEAAVSAIASKSRQLDDFRSRLGSEQDLLEQEREKLEQSTHSRHADDSHLLAEKARLKALQLRLSKEDEEVRAGMARLHQERAQLAVEKRDWHRDLETLREQEANLRHYEERLRDYQVRMEAERILPRQQVSSFKVPTEDNAARESWIKIQRASEIMEAEKAHLREDRLALKDWEHALKQKEEVLSKREKKLIEAAHQPPPPPVTPEEKEPAGVVDSMRSFTKAPFASAMAAFKGKK